MGLGKLLHKHDEHAEEGGTIDRPRAYDLFASIGYLGRRREVYTRLALFSGIRPGDKVLDVGCGTGYFSRILAQVAGYSGRVTGVDPSEAMIEYARRRAPANCVYEEGEGQALKAEDGSFDLVVSSLAVHHMPVAARAAAMREMFRVLRPGGRLLIAEFRPPSNRLLARLTAAVSGPAMRHSPHDLLGDLIPAAGFEILGEGDLPPMLYYVQAVKPTLEG
ncbi:class I SAM-dependent methyltransferase [Sinosporangium siamense]|uniref:Methyltransferase domain-containing protein n=1 Tax=Sinosporangium siamense TaxID=1367973 RepID=A0A919RF98_9ACTN|nr:class I SAM-dependent methyltransferase [Sinosporangium siamense]GII91730.1 hypothetical protein Ssi02_19610 [Sinosporangium siamense]